MPQIEKVAPCKNALTPKKYAKHDYARQNSADAEHNYSAIVNICGFHQDAIKV